MKAHQLKGILIRVCVVVITSLSSILLVELILNQVAYTDKPYMVDIGADTPRLNPHDSELIYTQHYYPNNFVTFQSREELHFRPDFVPNAQLGKGTFTILMLGDSITQGHDLLDEDAYPAVLEKLLIERGYDVNVLNAAVSGYGFDQQYLYAKRILSQYRPDLVVINVNENDIFDSNDNCLFVPTGREKYTQVPGFTSNLYIQSMILRSVPGMVKKSKTLNLLVTSLLGVRENHACSSAHVTVQDLLAKGRYLYSLLQQELSPQTQMLLTVVPTQAYFAREVPVKNEFLDRRSQLLTTFSEFELFDSNVEIARVHSPMLLLAHGEENIVGLSPSAYVLSARDLSREFFLDDTRDPYPLYGQKHLNEEGSRVFAEVVAMKLIKKYPLPRTTRSSN